ncbi:uncharacterized protein LOC105664458 [Ceratitis capitata]|uniref:Uncharacterized protein n=1 Tax=Ceratitis capitata TaxID=7213 RepID=W8AIW1_CERCA|nr:uncharacterized protein LOC105664458 [Ceratitis capitata]
MQAVKSKFANILNISITKERLLPYFAAPVLFLLVVLICQHLRPIGIFFLAVFFYWIYNTRCNFRIVPPPELQQKYKEYLKRVQDFRKQHTNLTMCFYIFSLSSFIFFGHVVIVTILFIIIYLLGLRYIEQCSLDFSRPRYRNVTYSDLDTSRENDDESTAGSETDYDDEFLPEKNSRNIILLDRACRDFTLHTAPTENTEDTEDEDDKSDDIPSDLLINDSIPELNENSTDDEDDLMPLIDAEKQNVEPSTSGGGAKMHFQKSHFKSDSTLAISSSSSEESLSKGLKFPDAETVDGARSHSDASTVKSAKIELPLGSNLVPTALVNNYDSIRNAIKAAVIVATQESPDEVSSESEFEFLGYE